MADERTDVLERAVVTGTKGNVYTIVKSLGHAPEFNLYECVLGDGKPGIVKIAASRTHNDILDREALVLCSMRNRAGELDAQADDHHRFHYGAFFPELIDSFVAEGQENRRVNVVRFFDGLQKLADLTTISGLCEVERVYIDPRTGAWILGKLIKTLNFAHEMGTANGHVSSDNILIERELHGLIVFDWGRATLYDEGAVPRYIMSAELSHAGSIALEALGADPDTGALPKSDQLQDDRFQTFIQNLANGKMYDTRRAHREFYDLVWTLWPREFYPFTAYPKKEGAQ